MLLTVSPQLRQYIEDQLTQDNKAMTKANNSEFASSLQASRAGLAEAQMSLAAVLASEAANKNCCVQVVGANDGRDAHTRPSWTESLMYQW